MRSPDFETSSDELPHLAAYCNASGCDALIAWYENKRWRHEVDFDTR